MPTPPTQRKVNPADAPILNIVLSSTTLPLATVDDYAENLLAQQISTVSGVAQVAVYGSQQYAVRIQLDPNALATRGIALTDVEQSIGNNNVNLPTGTLYGRDKATSIQATGQLMNAQAYGPMIVAYRNGAPVRLNEIGRVFDSVQNNKIAAWYNGTRGIMLAVQRQPGTNTIEIVDAVKKILPTFESQLPPAIKLNVFYDRSVSIRAAVRDVQESLLLALVLVVAVIFVFLRSVSATIIPSLALPLSIVGTFALMYAFGYSLDNLSLMALTLCVGFVVDDAIVMLENITRHMEMGKSRMQATLDGSKEIGFTIVSMTISLVAVFIPVLFMGGILGRLLREFAVTIIVAVLISGLVSLTLTPMLCSRMLADEHKKKHGRIYEFSERMFDALLGGYRRSLALVLHHQRLTLVVFGLITVATGVLFSTMSKGFLPADDSGQILVFTEAAQDVSFDAMANMQREVAEIVKQNPSVAAAMSSIGTGGPSPSLNVGRVFVTLTPRAGRPSAEAIVQQLRGPLSRVSGIKAYVQNVPAIRIGGQLTKSTYQYTLQGTDTTELYSWAPQIQEKLRSLPGLVDVTSDLQIAKPQVTVDIDRNKASALGVTAQAIESTLYDAYGQRQVSTIYAPTNQYWVVMELDPRYQTDPSVLSLLYVRSSTGALVPLNSVATLRPTVGPLAINHLGQLPSVTISFDLKRRRGNRRRDQRDQQGDRRNALADLDHRDLPGHRKSVRVVAARHGYPVDSGDFRDLSGARHPVRELYPSTDDSFRIADGRLRCAGHAMVVRDRSEHVCVRGHHHAGGHRQEERHHDDRFCDRSSAQGARRARRRDFPGVHHAFPAHHHDHHGRADGQPADRAGSRRGWRCPAAARACGCGWSRRLAGSDLVHNAGHLYLLRTLPAVARHTAHKCRRARRRPTRARRRGLTTACV